MEGSLLFFRVSDPLFPFLGKEFFPIPLGEHPGADEGGHWHGEHHPGGGGNGLGQLHC